MATRKNVEKKGPTQELTRVEPTPTPVMGVDRVVDLIERVLADRETPLDRMEQALALYQRVVDDAEAQRRRAAEVAFAQALPAMQAALPPIPKRGTGDRKHRYARWEDISPLVTPVLAEHGFSLQFPTEVSDNKITMRARLRHRDGHYEDSERFVLPADTSGSKNAVQALGSSTTYAKRYVSGLVLNLVFEDEVDDDGEAAGGGFLSDEQVETLRELVDITNTDISQFFAFAKASSWETIPAKSFQQLHGMLQKKRKMLAGS